MLKRLTVWAALLLLFSAYSCKQSVHRDQEKLKVLTTIAPLYSFTANVAGDAAYVENLLPSGAGPHEYALSPEDVRKAAEARLLVINGVNLEDWLRNLVAAVNEIRKSGEEDLIIVDSSDGVPLINNDPHIWLSPVNAVIQVRNIMNALIEADPDNGGEYRKNASEYIARLETLDREIKGETSKFRFRSFVTFHSAFRYFARDYGLEQAAVIREHPGAEPSPKHIAEVIETIKSGGIRCIFTEPQFTHRIVQSLANDLNLQIYRLDTLETGSFYKGYYEDKMRDNFAVLKTALNRDD